MQGPCLPGCGCPQGQGERGTGGAGRLLGGSLAPARCGVQHRVCEARLFGHAAFEAGICKGQDRILATGEKHEVRSHGPSGR